MIELTNTTFTEAVTEGYTLVDFWAEWCTPCLRFRPILEELSKEMAEIQFTAVNVEKYPELSSQYSVLAIPNLILFKDGEPVERYIGSKSKLLFKDELERALTK